MKRRIVTPDEEMYNIYLQEMRKPPEKRNEWLIKQCLPSCEIMTNPEAYKKKYGAYREEYERMPDKEESDKKNNHAWDY